jgi:hypothetical protein
MEMTMPEETQVETSEPEESSEETNKAKTKSALGGKFEDLVLAMVDPTVDFLAKDLNKK